MSTSVGLDRPGERAWSHPLVRHLSAIVALKLLILFLLWFLFFRLPDGVPRPGIDVHSHIAGPPGTAHNLKKNEVRP